MLSVGQMSVKASTQKKKIKVNGNMEGMKKHCPDFACILWSSMMSIGVLGASSYFQR